MELNQYITPDNRAAFAQSVGVSQDMVYQWIKGIRPVPTARCASIEQATNGQVTRKDLRPDDWHLIWPELATHHPIEVRSNRDRRDRRKQVPITEL